MRFAMTIYLLMAGTALLLSPVSAADIDLYGVFSVKGYEYADTTLSGKTTVLRGSALTIIWNDPKTKDQVTVKSPDVTILGIPAVKGKTAWRPDKITLKGAGSSIASAQRGLTITASEITIIAPKTPGQGIIESALAQGGVRLTQTQGDISGDASADTVEVKDKGDTAILTGNAVINYKNAENTAKATGDVITITDILPKNGQPADPRIIAESKGNQSHLSIKPAEAAK